MTENAGKTDRAFMAGLIGLTVLGAMLRVHQLNSGLWFDEIATLISSVRFPLWRIVTHFPGNNDHVLYSVLAHISIGIFEEHPWSIRLPAVIFGIASIPMLYLVGTMVTNRLEALLTTSILTVSFHHIWFSQNARGYTALLFWVLLATYLILQYLLHDKKSSLVAYAVVAALGSYTHLTMVFVVFTHAVICAWVIFDSKNSMLDLQDWKYAAGAFVAGGLLTLILYAPMLVDVQGFFTDIPDRKKVATPVWALWAALRGLQVGWGALWVVALGGMIFGAGLLSFFKRQRTVFFLFFLPGPVTLLLALVLGRPIFPRFVFFLIGFGLLITVRGAAVIGAWLADRAGGATWFRHGEAVLAALLTAGAIGFSLQSLSYGYRYPKQDFKQAIDYVVAHQEEDDLVAVVGQTAALPILEYFGMPWQRIEGADELLESCGEGRDVWLIFTFPAYIETHRPALWEVIQSDCQESRSFHGTIEGGDIHVYRCPPATENTNQ